MVVAVAGHNATVAVVVMQHQLPAHEATAATQVVAAVVEGHRKHQNVARLRMQLQPVKVMVVSPALKALQAAVVPPLLLLTPVVVVVRWRSCSGS
jgi:hypothetical protein